MFLYSLSKKLKAQEWEGEDKAGDQTNETGIAADTGTAGKQKENMTENKTIKTIDTEKAEKQEQWKVGRKIQFQFGMKDPGIKECSCHKFYLDDCNISRGNHVSWEEEMNYVKSQT